VIIAVSFPIDSSASTIGDNASKDVIPWL